MDSSILVCIDPHLDIYITKCIFKQTYFPESSLYSEHVVHGKIKINGAIERVCESNDASKIVIVREYLKWKNMKKNNN